jgi:hypothetical protein
VQELELAKCLKQSKKSISQSSWHNLAEKTSTMKTKIIRGRTSSTSTDGSGVAQALTHALDFFDSGSSVYDGEAAIPTLPQKRPQKSPVLKSVSRLSKAFAMKGTIEQFLTLRLSESYCI